MNMLFSMGSYTRDAGNGQVLFTPPQDIVSGGNLIYRAGEQVLMALNPSDVSNQTIELDNYLGGYKQGGLIADMISGVILVDKEAGTRRDFDKANAYEVIDTAAGRNGALREVDMASLVTAYKTGPYGLATFIKWETANESAWAVEARAAKFILDKVFLDREVREITALTTTANWNSNNQTTILAANKWDTGTTIHMVADLQARCQASSHPVSCILMNPIVAGYFLASAEVAGRLRAFNGDNAAPVAMPKGSIANVLEIQVVDLSLLGLPPLYICSAKKLNPATSLLDYILADDVVLLTNPPNEMLNDGEIIATRKTFRTKGRSGVGIVTNQYVPVGGRGINSGRMFEVGFAEVGAFCCNTAGGLLKDVLSTV